VTQRVLMGNEAIGRGIVECGCALATSYPGTPASEILEAVATFAAEARQPMHIEWSVNEKVAYEVALAASYTGKRVAVSMKQVGLNVASDPFMRSAYLGVKGGFLLVSADDPGPHSSQTEQDSRFFAMFAKIPVLDPSSPREAKEMVRLALELSEAYEIPVMLRPTTRVCHARQAVPLLEPEGGTRTARFEKDPKRWCATPRFVLDLHRGLTGKLERLASDPRLVPTFYPGDGTRPRTCIIASGVSFAHTWDVLDELELTGTVDRYHVKAPFPLAAAFIERVRAVYDRVLVIEETYPVIELQLRDQRIAGRVSRLVPNEGELTPEIIREVLAAFLGLAVSPPTPGVLRPPGARPTLCAGCGHRAAYYAIRQSFPGGIFPGDIGCYTLGMNLEAVDTVHCMGAGISQAAGFYHAYAQDAAPVPTIVATIGDSTFFHSGVPALVNAVSQKARIIVVILDNATTAMTGHQPTPQLGITATGGQGKPVLIRDLVLASGVSFLREAKAYDIERFTATLKEADGHCRSSDGGVAVVIASSPCVLAESVPAGTPRAVRITEDCSGCRECLDMFECPALVWDDEAGRVGVSRALCAECGVCLAVCPTQAIVADDGEVA